MGSSGKGATVAAVREAPAPSGTANRLESGTRPATTRPRRVLLVEDEDMVRKVLTRMLAARGFEVHAAASGPEAIAIFDAREAKVFDLLVTDLMLPEGGRARRCPTSLRSTARAQNTLRLGLQLRRHPGARARVFSISDQTVRLERACRRHRRSVSDRAVGPQQFLAASTQAFCVGPRAHR